MKLTHVCIITNKIPKLTQFYETILQIPANHYGNAYVEFETKTGILSLFSLVEHEKLAPDSAETSHNKSMMLEFQVDDVDAQYQRLKDEKISIVWVKPPTTQAYGNRSIYFRDPDGNLINFYMSVKK